MDTLTRPEYFRPEYAPHLELFHCEPLHVDLSPIACARQYGEQERYPCATCTIGAMHAELERIAVRAPTNRTIRTCARCETGCFRRLVAGRLCASCYNRQREALIGRNRKGDRPTIRLLTWEALLVAPSEIHTVAGRFAGIDVQHLGGQDYAVRILALTKDEVCRTLAALWPSAEIVAVGKATAPEAYGRAPNLQRRVFDR